MFSQDEIDEMRAELDWDKAKKVPTGVDSWTLDQNTADQIVQYQYGYDHEQGISWRMIVDRSDCSVAYECAEG